ncbi:hypothetical protein [Burkholderia pseudomultivorans]|uniref:hypothetical protein n=1 Tax=Burkholderia pseudomultivorans TaxID=1207504 RepID=UPI00188E8E33|nr:hypothetical protein [Burkholderia pseudomultivorans]MBF5008296.1 hypothetical protein [Burkholderia pseudomultivorans]
MQHVDLHGRIAFDPIENLEIAVSAMPHAVSFEARHQWKRERHLGKAQAFFAKRPHERDRALRIVARDAIRDQLEFGYRKTGQAHGHA